jgi:hypothetical protein
MFDRVVWITAIAAAGFGFSAMAETAQPYADVTGPVLGPCPGDFEKLLPNCAIGAVITRDGKIKACYCDVPGAQFPQKLEDYLPLEKQVKIYESQLEVGKVDDKTNPRDPCSWIKIGGVLKYICN